MKTKLTATALILAMVIGSANARPWEFYPDPETGEIWWCDILPFSNGCRDDDE